MKIIRPFMMMLTLTIMLGGCARSLGYAGMHPGFVECKGKGVITGTGTLAGIAGVGGTGMNTFTLQADCGDGFSLKQGNPAIDDNTKPIKP